MYYIYNKIYVYILRIYTIYLYNNTDTYTTTTTTTTNTTTVYRQAPPPDKPELPILRRRGNRVHKLHPPRLLPGQVRTRRCTCRCSCTYTHTTYTHMHICTYTHTHILHMHIHTYAHIHIYTHTNMHTYTHTHTNPSLLPPLLPTLPQRGARRLCVRVGPNQCAIGCTLDGRDVSTGWRFSFHQCD
jgi:hypothetical protein